MKNSIFILLLNLYFQFSYAQKLTLGIDSYKSLPQIRERVLSDDGKFIFYTVNNEPVGGSTSFLYSIQKEKKFNLGSLSGVKFSSHNNFLLGKSYDNLFIYNLKTFTSISLSNISKYQCFKKNGKEWLIVQSSDKLRRVTIKLIDGNGKIDIENVSYYLISPDGNYCIYQQSNKKNIVNLLEISTGKSNVICDSGPASNFIFDNPTKKIAFIINSSGSNEIWYAEIGKGKAKEIANEKSKGIIESFYINPGKYWSFSKDGERLFFEQNEKLHTKEKGIVTVWSYQDQILQSELNDMWNGLKQKSLFSTLEFSSLSVRTLLQNNQRIISSTFKYDTDTVFVAVSENFTTVLNGTNRSYVLCNVKTGKQDTIKDYGTNLLTEGCLSPTGKYFIYYDPDSINYYCYDILEKKNRCISKSITSRLSQIAFSYQPTAESERKNPVGIAGWDNGDRNLFIHTAYDIWIVDPTGEKKALNATMNVGNNNNIVFHLAYAPDEGKIIVKNGEILLSAFNLSNKNFGFFTLNVKNGFKLLQLSMMPFYCGDIYSFPSLIKALNGTKYLLSGNFKNKEYNLYYSSNLRKFKNVSNIHSMDVYNGIKVELHKYTDSLGNQLEGLLYKPENFNPTLVYPLVFNYYESKSNQLNKAEDPKFNGADIPVFQLVSNGYLVFKPNILIEPEHVGSSVLRSVIAAADYLSIFPFIDRKKMAISGHSFGGYETNYIVTHSNRFAAAVSAAGVSNLTSAFNDLWGEGGSSQRGYVLNGPFKMIKTLSKEPKIYIDNSPIFSAGEMNIPLLMMHNPKDLAVDFVQSRSFFIELRSLQKKVWLVSYKDEAHSILNEENMLDYNIKILGFLDYYLKGKQKPEWMKEHISLNYFD